MVVARVAQHGPPQEVDLLETRDAAQVVDDVVDVIIREPCHIRHPLGDLLVLEHERRASAFGSPRRLAASGCIKLKACATQRAMVAPMIVWPLCARRIRANASPFIAGR